MVVLIPSHEPDERLVNLVERLRGRGGIDDILVVDDGSGPAYRGLLRRAEAAGAAVIGCECDHGEGHALKKGFAWAMDNRPGEPVVCADPDGRHTSADVLSVAALARTCPDTLVLGARSFTDDSRAPARDRIGIAITAWFFRLITGLTITDALTGLRGYPAGMLPWLCSIESERLEYESSVLLGLRRNGWRMRETPVTTICVGPNRNPCLRPLADSARICALLGRACGPGLTGFGIDLVTLLLLHALTGGLLLSVMGARIIGAGASHLLASRPVPGPTTTGRSLPRRIALAIGVLGTNCALMWLSTSMLGVPLAPAKIITGTTLLLLGYGVRRAMMFDEDPLAAGPGPGPVSQYA